MKFKAFCVTILFSASTLVAVQAQNNALQPPDPAGTDVETTEGSGTYDSVQAQANQAYQLMMNRNFRQALQTYQQAAGSNPEYQKMVDFCDAILDRMQEMLDEQLEIFGKTTQPNFRMEQLTKEEVNAMLDYQFRSLKAGQNLQDLGVLSEVPVADLGLDFEGSDQVTLGEYLGWVQVRGSNERIWHRARIRALERQMTFARMEIKEQQRQEKLQRVEEFRRRRIERQGGQLGGVGGGGGFGGGLGGGLGGGGGGFGGGGFGGGGFGGGGGAF